MLAGVGLDGRLPLGVEDRELSLPRRRLALLSDFLMSALLGGLTPGFFVPAVPLLSELPLLVFVRLDPLPVLRRLDALPDLLRVVLAGMLLLLPAEPAEDLEPDVVLGRDLLAVPPFGDVPDC